MNEYAEKIDELRVYQAKGSKYIDLKESVFRNVNKFYDGWEKIVYGFKNGILPLFKNNDSGNQWPNILDTPEQRRFDDFSEQIRREQKNIDIIKWAW